MPDDGLVTIMEAIAGAEAELASGEAGEAEAPLPGAEAEAGSAGDQAADDGAESPEASGNGDEGEALDLDGFEDLFSEGSDSPGIDPTSEEFLSTTITIQTPNGPESITVQEAGQGYLRQSDYTRKTQEVAELRKATQSAVEFYEEFQKNPLEFVKVLAARAELIDANQAPEGKLDFLPKQEDFDARVEEAVQERLANDPSLQEAKIATARAAVNNTFDGIETKYGVKLTPDHRTLVMKQANKSGTTDLELVFQAMLGQLQAKQSRRAASSSRPSGGSRAVADQEEVEKPPSSVMDAIKRAELELSGA